MACKNLLIALALSSFIWLSVLTTETRAQVPVTVTGLVGDAGGNPAVAGTVVFDIQPQSSGIQYYVQNVTSIVPQEVVCGINASGQVMSQQNLANPCKVWGNDVISPANTTYTVTFFPNGLQQNSIPQQCIVGATYNLNSPRFCPVVSIVPQYNTITTPQINSNIVPAVPDVFTLGNAQTYFASAYVDNLFMNTCSGPGCVFPNYVSKIIGTPQSIIGQLNIPTGYVAITGTYQLSATRGLGGYVTPELYGAWGDGIHDDTAAIQACWNASANTSLYCRMAPIASGANCGVTPTYGCYLVNSQLVLSQNTRASGNSSIATVIKSNYNGPAIVNENGPVNGVKLTDFQLLLNKSLANSAGMYFTATTDASGTGGLWYSEFKNITISNPAKECIRLDGGGVQPGYTYNLPNQFLQFNAFQCNGPLGQAHPAQLIEISGQAGQVVFRDGSANGDATSTGSGTGITYTYYPNPLVLINPISGSSTNINPTNVTFSNFTVQSGQTGFNIQYAQNINIVDGSHFEDLGALITSSNSTLSIRDAYMGNVGTSTGGIFNFAAGVRADIEDTTINADPTHPVAALATCGADPVVKFKNNNLPLLTAFATSSCATEILSIASSTLTFYATEVLVNGDGGATPIATLSGPTDPGSTVTLVAWGNSFKLTSGGNIWFGSFTAPLTIPQNSSVTLRLYDQGRTYVVEGISGLSGNLAGTPTLPNGTTATTQTAGDNSTKLATTAYVATPGAISPTTVTVSGNVTGLAFISSAAGAGYLQLGQGTAPSTGTTAVTLSAPATVTSYVMELPAAVPADASHTFLSCTAAAPSICSFTGPVVVNSLTTTAAISDNVTLTGMTTTGHCGLTATNASAATNIATTYISAKAANQITVTHTATASMTYDVTCTVF